MSDFVIVDADDWNGLYIDGVLRYQNHEGILSEKLDEVKFQ